MNAFGGLAVIVLFLGVFAVRRLFAEADGDYSVLEQLDRHRARGDNVSIHDIEWGEVDELERHHVDLPPMESVPWVDRSGEIRH